jgi:hypothetical protein
MKNYSSSLVHYRLSNPFTLNLSTNKEFIHNYIVLRLDLSIGPMPQSCYYYTRLKTKTTSSGEVN